MYDWLILYHLLFQAMPPVPDEIVAIYSNLLQVKHTRFLEIRHLLTVEDVTVSPVVCLWVHRMTMIMITHIMILWTSWKNLVLCSSLLFFEVESMLDSFISNMKQWKMSVLWCIVYCLDWKCSDPIETTVVW